MLVSSIIRSPTIVSPTTVSVFLLIRGSYKGVCLDSIITDFFVGDSSKGVS